MDNIGSLCRACLCDTNVDLEEYLECYNIFETDSLAEKLQKCCNIELHPDDGYSPLLCETCYATVIDFYEFQQLCGSSLQQFDQIKSEKEHIRVLLQILEDHSYAKGMDYHTGCHTELNLDTKSKVESSKDLLADGDGYESIVAESIEIEILAGQGKRMVYKVTKVQRRHGNMPSRRKGEPVRCKQHYENSYGRDDVFTDINRTNPADLKKVSGADVGQTQGMATLNSLCRTCMINIIDNTKEHMHNYNIFETEGLAKKYMMCCNIEIQPFDDYPPCVCNPCCVNIHDFYDFQDMCRESSEKFSKMLEKQTPNIMRDHVTDSIDIESDSTDDSIVNDMTGDEHSNDILRETQEVIAEIVSDYDSDVAGDENDPLGGSTDCVLEEAIKIARGEKLEEINHWDDYDDCSQSSADFVVRSEVDGEKQRDSRDNVIDNEADRSLDCNNDLTSISSVKEIPETVKNLSCGLCPQNFSSELQLIAHKRRHQGLSGYPCPRKNCKHVYNRLQQLRQHLDDHDDIPRQIFTCEFNNCKQEYATKRGLQLHLRRRHNEGQQQQPDSNFVCESCGTIFKNSAAYRKHQYLHVDQSLWPFQCDIDGCSKAFRTKGTFKIHKNRHYGIKPYACKYCDKRFCSNPNLLVHLNYHTREKKWSCRFCPMVCYTPADLRLHIRQKHENNPNDKFPCRFCNKILSSRPSRKYHEMNHTGERPHVCEKCGRSFTHSTGLKMHKQTHKDTQVKSKMFYCSVCNRGLTSAYTLKNHEMTHTGEKPFKCDACGIKFRYMSNLARHHKQKLCRKYKTTTIDEDVEIIVE